MPHSKVERQPAANPEFVLHIGLGDGCPRAQDPGLHVSLIGLHLPEKE